MKKGSEKKVAEKKVTTEKNVSKKETMQKNKHYIAAQKTKVKKEKKENIFKRVLKYFKGVGKEFKRIRWTDKKDLLKYSICTLVFVFFFGVYFYAIDWIVLLIRSMAK